VFGESRFIAVIRSGRHASFRRPGSSSPRSLPQTTCQFESFPQAKGRPEKPARLLDDVRPWEYTGNIAHPTEKVISVIKPLVENFSPVGGIVLDAFCGSDSTLVSAALAGRRYLGRFGLHLYVPQKTRLAGLKNNCMRQTIDTRRDHLQRRGSAVSYSFKVDMRNVTHYTLP